MNEDTARDHETCPLGENEIYTFWEAATFIALSPQAGSDAFSYFASDTLANNRPGQLTKLADALITWTE